MKHKIPLETALAHRELVAKWQLPHEGDHYLVMVLCRVGEKPAEGVSDTREWVTWFYNADSGGFNNGHYFKADEKGEAHSDFLARCTQECRRSFGLK